MFTVCEPFYGHNQTVKNKKKNVAPVDYVVNATSFSADVETQRRRRVARKRDSSSEKVGNPIRKRRLSDSDDSDTDSQSNSGSDLDLEVKVRVQLPNSCKRPGQKTLDALTHCSKCDLVQGKFCGDCLDMTYGENVIEANQNPDWVCPVCLGICSCSVCLKKEARSTRTSFSHVAEDLGNVEVATDIAGEIKKIEQRSTRMRKN